VHEIPGHCLSIRVQLCFPGGGLLQPELHREIPATRDARDSRAGLCGNARLEVEARRLAGIAGEGPASSASRKQVVNEVSALRRDGEMKSYVDLLFLALVVLLCISKIVTD
jgi:hypothetical protein